MTKTRRLSALVFLFVAIFALWWGISVLSQRTVPASPAITEAPTQVADTLVPYEATSSIIVHHSIKNGINDYSGALMLPSGCDTLGTGISTSGQGPVHITLLLTLTADAQCVQTPVPPSEQTFAASLGMPAASSTPVFDGITVNGAIVPSSLVEDK